MARNIKIIEFYGLPGCGKTTLVNQLLSFESYRIGTVQDVMAFYNRKSVIYKLSHLPIRKWWILLTFLWSLSGKRKNGKDYYISLFYKTLAYSYSVNQSDFDLIVVDHGIIQQLGSILHNANYQISDKSLRKFLRFVNIFKETQKVYCYITSDLSLCRMKKRNRDGGRIDAVMYDTQIALQYLGNELVLFNNISKLLKYENPILDMTKPTKSLADEVMKNVERMVY